MSPVGNRRLGDAFVKHAVQDCQDVAVWKVGNVVLMPSVEQDSGGKPVCGLALWCSSSTPRVIPQGAVTSLLGDSHSITTRFKINENDPVNISEDCCYHITCYHSCLKFFFASDMECFHIVDSIFFF